MSDCHCEALKGTKQSQGRQSSPGLPGGEWCHSERRTNAMRPKSKNLKQRSFDSLPFDVAQGRSLRMTMIGQSVFNPGRLRSQIWIGCPGLARGEPQHNQI